MQRPRKPADPDYTLFCDEPISLGESATVDQAGGYDGEGEEVPWRPRAVAARRALAAIRRSSVARVPAGAQNAASSAATWFGYLI